MGTSPWKQERNVWACNEGKGGGEVGELGVGLVVPAVRSGEDERGVCGVTTCTQW